MAEEMDVNKFPARLRVLAVDDDPTTLFVLKRQLQLCNYNVTMVTEAETALEMVKERKDRDDQFDLVISDVVMPGIDGFKLLELIGLEMDIPVIMLSANDEMETMMKGIKHGARDYLVKPARMEQVRNIWMHVVRKSRTDIRSNINDKKKGANHTKKHSKKNKKDGDCAEEDKEDTSTQMRQRIKWSGHLHHKFVEAINQIGMHKAFPKKILEVMNVDGLSRDNVASHLQKYRIYLRKLNDGTLRNSNPFIDKSQAWLGYHTPTDMNAGESSHHHPVPVDPSPSSIGVSRSSNAFARMNCPSAFGMDNLQQEMELVGNISNGAVFNTSRPFSSGSSHCSSANISYASPPSATSMSFHLSPSCSSYASILRGKMLEANRGIPFDASKFFEEIADSEITASSSNLPLQSPELANQPSVPIQPLSSPELVNQPSIQFQSSTNGLFNHVPRESQQFVRLCNPSNSWRVGVPSRFPDIDHYAGTPVGSSQGINVRVNQLSRFAASSANVQTFGNEYQNQMAGPMGRATPVVGFSEQVAPFNFGSSTMQIGISALGSSSTAEPASANLQIGNSIMPTQMPNGGGATRNLLGVGTVGQQPTGDQVNSNSKLPAGTGQVQNGAIDGVDNTLADWPDFLSNDNAFFYGSF